ncbi:MBOAT family O-acyltransferase [Zunongwangia sp. F260]|uniref:MBOAT family O-acyltransferase n=1 Tax=Autumnicola lenta TaxID=3075593 RepID=A0ABU3CFN9_9FLAO|nr:MBOAT family O-acyltransferase [Zunongwangia sp. F260]MDT0645174.1 MBOAT family O-acyltransferase [Zunongwangia sp. F260]
MLFNSFEFALFLPIIFLLYWIIGGQNIRWQNVLILIGSYFFYGAWDSRFLILILLSSLIDYYAGIIIDKSSSHLKKKIILWLSIVWNLGVLFIFKYYNFFIESLGQLLELDPQSSLYTSFQIILPVGLSFYTFQTLSYTIDVYRGKIKPTHKLLEFLCFVSFFPQLVAGPIERASFLLPQFFKERKFDTLLAKEGLRQVLWGLFKKMVIADNLALAVNEIFANPESFQSLELFYGLVLFYFQIYCDFSGYADVAIGTAKLLGFRLSINFNLPHFAESIPDFWRKWNITLSRWFRDYVHIPLLKNRKRNIYTNSAGLFVTFFLIGLWHGANWTFIAFGVIHAAYMIGNRIKTDYLRANKLKTGTPRVLSIGITFILVVLSIVFFRAPTISIAWNILSRIFSMLPDNDFETLIGMNLLFLPLMLLLELVLRNKEYPFQNLQMHIPKIGRWCIYYIFVYFILRYGGPKESFIYFQF